MGIFDRIEQNHSDDYRAVERIGNANQHHKLPMKDKADNFNVMRSNLCRSETEYIKPKSVIRISLCRTAK